MSTQIKVLNRSQEDKIESIVNSINQMNKIRNRFKEIVSSIIQNESLKKKFSIDVINPLKNNDMYVLVVSSYRIFIKLNIYNQQDGICGKVVFYLWHHKKRLELGECTIKKNGRYEVKNTNTYHSDEIPLICEMFILYPLYDLITKFKNGELNET